MTVCLLPVLACADDEEVLFENEQICVSKWKMAPGETLELHRDENPQVVIALQGGTITRIAEDGSTTNIFLPAGQAVFQEPDLEWHHGINASNETIEAITIELKVK